MSEQEGARIVITRTKKESASGYLMETERVEIPSGGFGLALVRTESHPDGILCYRASACQQVGPAACPLAPWRPRP